MKERISHLRRQLETFPRVSLSIIPTPCHRLDYLSDKYGVEIYCKRDDMTGFGFGGNKSRKLAFLMAEALEHRCDTVVTSGGIQSNFCRLTAAAGVRLGMDVHLVLGGKEVPSRPSANLLLDRMLGARIHFVASMEWSDWERESARIASELEADGKRVFRMPIGGSVPVGAAGYAAVLLEIMDDEQRLDRHFEHIIHACGSGGTQAGLVAGKDMTGWPGAITGISVAFPREEVESAVYRLAVDTASILGGKVSRDSVAVDDRFVGAGYAIRTDLAERAIEVFARREGIFLDHVYTGKAAAAFLHYLEEGRFKGKTVLFIHTGGQVELFA